ncbi:hypothetical protein CK820_G0043993 [Pan troglodytes]|uniref:Transcription factor AP-2 C-terminal domain-containing protein n=1 Tax=Pan troglodytes TaxID=9598 RepID=A0A2J8JW72_PANTR|nr:hypothetical protein CK820_G0043993 [Pan troglodytes]
MLWKITDNVKYEEDCEDRHDGSSNGNPRVPHLSSAGQHLYSPAPPLSHTGVAEYQPPPYFPPPYQQLAYSQSADPYSHLGEAYAAAINPLHQPAPTGSQQQAWPGRQSQEGAGLPSHHGRPAGLLPHLSGLEAGAVSARRDAYRRSDLLLPHAHALDAAGLAENLGLHDMPHQMDEVQVSGAAAPARTCSPYGLLPPPRTPLGSPELKRILSSLPQNVDDQHLLLHDQTVIRKGEAVHLARDFAYVCEAEFPSKPVAEYLTRPHLGGRNEMAARKNMLLAAQQLCKEFTELLSQDRTPHGTSRLAPVLETNIQNCLSHFSLITHGFGSQAICAAVSALQNYIKEALIVIDKSYMNPGDQSPADSNKTLEKMEKHRK